MCEGETVKRSNPESIMFYIKRRVNFICVCFYDHKIVEIVNLKTFLDNDDMVHSEFCFFCLNKGKKQN